MEVKNVLEIKNLRKEYKGFTLDIPELNIPQGFATALIGENGAGKSTLLNILTGIRLDYKGDIRYFGQYTEKDREEGPVKEMIGYTGPGNYYLPQWNVKQIEEISELLFDNFHLDRFESMCDELALFPGQAMNKSKKVSEFSDGNKMKRMIANALARDTKMLIMDEPASPLDPLMRDKLCELIRTYITEGNGEKSVFFSTHNISDMENVTDYAIIMEHERIMEQGFVEDLKEKYVLVKGEAKDLEEAKKVLYSVSSSNYGFEGIILAQDLDKLAGMDISKEVPSLFQISVAVMKQNSLIRMK